MKRITFYMLVLFTLHLSAQGPEWKWAKATGGDKQNMISAIVVDNSGNSYSVGYFYSSSLPFGNVTLTNTSPNNADVFLFKCNKGGDLNWVKKATGIASETTFTVAVDNDGNAYWAGSFSSPQLTFDSITLNNAGPMTSDIFVVKYNKNGALVWAKSFGGFGNDFATTIKFDKQSSIYLTGNFASSPLNFDNVTLSPAGNEDLFAVKMNLNGNVLWAKSVGGIGSEFSSDMGVDKMGNCYLAGRFSSPTLNFGANVLTCDSASKFIVAKFSSTGIPMWAKTEKNENAQYIAVDGLSNVYVTGSINGVSSTFGQTTFMNADRWSYDQYLVKYNQNGDLQWAKNAGGTKNDMVRSISIDGENKVYLAGAFESPVLNFGQFALNSNGYFDMYMVRYAPDGTIDGALKYGGTKNDEVGGLAVDLNGDMYLVGMFESPEIDFGNTKVEALTGNNIFITSTAKTDSIAGCMNPMAKNYNPLATKPAPCEFDTTGGNQQGLKYSVKVPSGTYMCFFAGQINGWSQQPMNKVDSVHFEIMFPNATVMQEYKYCSGPGWRYEELDASNNPIANRKYTPNDVVIKWADIYNPNSTTPVYGCMDSKAKNYNPLATAPAQCIYDSIVQPIYGCMDTKALNYNPLATAPGQCLYDTTQIIGCMDIKALNYNPRATVPGPCNFDTTIVTPTSLTYRVTVPAGTVECYFAGMINNWTQQKMTKTGNLQYEITFQNATKMQEYKYCSGPGWAFGETTNEGKNRTWTENDVVTGWTNIYNPNATATDVTYRVTVPVGTNACYFAGAANNWQFSQMIKVGDNNYMITINTAYRDKYKYLSGPDWKYCELDTAYQSTADRNYAQVDIVKRWGLVYNPNGADEIVGCTNPKALNFNKYANKEDGSCKFPITTVPVYGCTNPVARNYNPLATIENGSCLFGDSTMIVWGCTNSTASNYNPKAVKDNGTCVFGTTNYVFGCMNPTAKNYNSLANKEDGSCIFVDSAMVIWGCTNPTATNYNPKANKENGSCTFVDSVQVVWGCTNVLAKNYNPKATMENGSCIFASDPTVIFGCTKPGALNYNPLATKENGSCVFKDSVIVVLGCTNPMARNYNPTATKDNGTCIYQDSTKMILGCTNPTAKNFNRLATHDNGTCVFSEDVTKIFGCTKPSAKNFNPLATVENGSCVFADTIKLPVYGCTNKLALNYNPLATVNNGTCKFEELLVKGCMDKKAKNYNPLAKVNDGSCTYDSIRVVYGCTDSLALNYNPLAKIDNNNCMYQTLIPGCMDVLALNYNPYANVKDGSCKYPLKIWGCTDKSALNYNSLATHNDGNCQYVTQILGCTDPLATNFNPLATKDNRTCVFPPVVSLGCTNKQALNYNPNANTDNGTCVFETVTDTIKGCMDKTALNYNPVATASNGSCVYVGVSIAGCTSPMALNYNPKATDDDESCIFAKPVNIVLPVDNDILVEVKDTLAKILENSCSFDFNTPIDTVYIVSSTIVGINEIQVVWAIKQGTNITNITSNYMVDNDGKALLYLSLVCNSASGLSGVKGIYRAPADGSSVQGVTVSSYYQIPSNTTRLIALNQGRTGVSIYPNPVKDLLHINFTGKGIEKLTVQISTLDGKRILSKELNVVQGYNRFEINTSLLNEGIYMVNMYSNSGLVHVNKLVKN